MGMLHGVNKGLEREMKGMGWGSLEMEGEFPLLKIANKKGGNRGARKEKLGPSDIIFPSSSSVSEKTPAYSREAVRSWEDEEQEFKTKMMEKEGQEEEEISFSYKITWVYYGMTRDENGKKTMRECTQMPGGVEMDFERAKSGKTVGIGEGKADEEEKEAMSEDKANKEEEEGEERWKIDL